jgi:hypothetical protein
VVVEQRRAVGEGHGREPEGLRAERVDQVADAGPDQQVDDPVGEEALHRAVGAGIDVGERVGEGAGGRPRHGEDHV